MTQLSDEQLMLLEQLTYFDNDIKKAAGISADGTLSGLDEQSTIGDLIDNYTDAIDNLRSKGNKAISNEMTGNEIAALIEAIQEDEELKNLRLQTKDNSSGAYCFTDSSGEAVVILRGTADGDEWYDNFTGLGTSDTKVQKETHDFIENLPYDDITVVGHSKGGNKAMYVAIVSDKVSRAISMDGQGFSQEFIHKYEEEIRKKGNIITNYSLSADFVHILLYQPDGSRQVYIEGNDYVSGKKNHCPANLFRFVQDENGNWKIETGEDGKPSIHITAENEGVAYLHRFTIFVLENCPIEDRVIIGDYLGHIMGCAMRPNSYWFKDADGTVYDSSNIKEYIFKHPDILGLILGYVIKYGENYNLTDKQIAGLLDLMGLREIILLFQAAIQAYAISHPIEAVVLNLAGLTITELLKLFLGNIVDGKRDPIIEGLLAWISGWLSEQLGFPLNLDGLWRSIEESYTAIGDVNAQTGRLVTMESESRVFDYSQKTYNTLLDTLSKIDNYTSGSISSWDRNYSSEKWYNDLSISLFVNGIESYSEYIKNINEECRRQIVEIFNRVWTIDHEKAGQLMKYLDDMAALEYKITNILG